MNTTTEIPANINSAQCIKTTTHAGYEIVTNICTGKVTTVEWGLFDWFAGILIIFGALALVLLLLSMVFAFYKMATD